jgi:heme ABC exporter ATP-binding subunit CcmA
VNAVETREVDKQYGPVRALRSVSLDIPPGTINLIAGPNGAGKSTLLRILAALTRPTSGSVRLLGRDPFGRQGGSVRGEIGWLGAENGLYGDLTIQENLTFAAQLSACSASRMESVLEDFGLGPFRNRRVRMLSQGYRRRTGLARVFLRDPSLLVLDEPWNALDAESSERLSKVLCEQRERGSTVLVAAHGGTIAREIADRVIEIERGAVSDATGDA